MYGFVLPEKSKLRRKITLECTEENLVDTEVVKQQEIKSIVERHLATGKPFPNSNGSYIDTVAVPLELTDRYELLRKGKEAYEGLPDAAKALFGSAGEFIDSFETPSGIKRLVQSGILKLKVKAKETVVSEPDNAQAASGTQGGTASGGGEAL